MEQEPTNETQSLASTEVQLPEHPAQAPHWENDAFLQEVVFLTNQGSFGQASITLQMGGLLVSGLIIPGDEYFDTLAETMANAAGADTKSAEVLRTYYSSFSKAYKKKREAKTLSADTTAYIHLKDCTFSGLLPLRNLKELWRGRISLVEGFFFGRLSAATTEAN